MLFVLLLALRQGSGSVSGVEGSGSGSGAPTLYSHKGCFKDTRTRALPLLDERFNRADGIYYNRVNPVEKCYQAAKARGFRYFAVQNGGQCAAGHSGYDRFGISSNCVGGEGGAWANDVYMIDMGGLALSSKDVVIGPSYYNSRTVTVRGPVTCPTRVAQRFWGGHWRDTFEITTSGNKVTAKRTDWRHHTPYSIGWRMNLRIKCWTGEGSGSGSGEGIFYVDETTTAAPKETTTAAPKDTTAAPKETTTAAPKETTTAAPKETTTAAPKETTTAAPKETTTAAPKETTTAAPKETTTAAPKETHLLCIIIVAVLVPALILIAVADRMKLAEMRKSEPALPTHTSEKKMSGRLSNPKPYWAPQTPAGRESLFVESNVVVSPGSNWQAPRLVDVDSRQSRPTPAARVSKSRHAQAQLEELAARVDTKRDSRLV